MFSQLTVFVLLSLLLLSSLVYATNGFLYLEFLSIAHRTFHVTFGIACGDVLAFVVVLFTGGKSDLQFSFAAREVEFERYEGVSFFSRFSKEFQYFFFVHEEFAFAHRLMVEDVALFVRADVHLTDHHFTVFDVGIAVFEVGSSCTK